MKKSFKIMAVAAAMFISIIPAAFGQEMIRGAVSTELCDSSIIRVVDKNSYLVYNRNHYSTFFLMTPSEDTLNTLYMEPFFVNDFEIYENNVYFCGYKLDGTKKSAIFGYFYLPNFPNSTFYYWMLDTCTEMKKLDLYSMDDMIYSERHMVMTGTTGTRSDAIVDKLLYTTAPYAPTAPTCFAYFSNDENESFDDVAVTKNYIAVSSRNRENGFPIIDFWNFPIPPFISNIFISPITHIRIGSPAADSPVYLKNVLGDRYAAVYNIMGYSKIAMLRMDAPNIFHGCTEITCSQAMTVHPMDIKLNYSSYTYDILARDERRDNPRYTPTMQIYHVTQSIIGNIVPNGYGTEYPEDEVLWSLATLPQPSHYFVASGEDWHLPKVYRFKDDQWDECTLKFSYDFINGKPDVDIKEDEVSENSYKLERKVIETSLKKTPVMMYCGEY